MVEFPLDEIRFVATVASFPGRDDCPAVAIYVNARDLRLVVNEAEGRLHFDRRGRSRLARGAIDGGDGEPFLAHAFLPLTTVPPLSVLWSGGGGRTTRWEGLGRRPPFQTPDGRVAVLTCSCGDFGCGGIAARIEVGERIVVWSDISHPFAPTLLALGPYRFSRSGYEFSLAGVSDL